MTALVTGAAGGIGSAIAAELEANGHKVIRHDLRADGPTGPMDVFGDLAEADVLTTVVERVCAEQVDIVVAAHGVAGAEALATIDRAKAMFIMRANTVS